MQRLPLPVAESNRNQRAHHQHGNSNTSTRSQSHISEHVREPEGPNKAPGLPHECDKDSNTTRFLWVAVNSIRDQHSGDDLVPCCGDSSTDNRRDVPVTHWSLVDADQEDYQTADREKNANVAEPKSELRLGLLRGGFLRTSTHPHVT